MQNYGNEKIYPETLENKKLNFELLAEQFSEGNDNLKMALLTSWKNDVQTVGCCIGHKERCDENGMVKKLCVDFDTKEIVERKLSFEDSLSSYISFKIKIENSSVLSKLYTALDEKYLNKISLQLSVNPHGFLMLDVHVAESIKDDFFKFITNFYTINNNYQESDLFNFFISLEENARENNDCYNEIIVQEKMMTSPLTYFYKKGDDTLLFFGEEINEENIIGTILNNISYLKYISDSNSNIPECFVEYIIESIIKRDINAIKYINKNVDNLIYARICMEVIKQDSKVLAMVDKNKLNDDFRDSLNIRKK